MSYLKNLFTSLLILFSFASIAKANPTLADALAQKRQVAIFNVNDVFTDADSIQAFMESLLLASEYGALVSQYFVTDDEANEKTVKVVCRAIEDGTSLKDDNCVDIRQHYSAAPQTQPIFGYRAQDTATVLFPLADHLKVKINVIQGDLSANPTYNPYYGNFRKDHCQEDEKYIHRINKETGSRAVIEAMRKEQSEGKLVYVLNGGSLKLLSEIQRQAPDLLPSLDVTVMGFRQPMNFPPFNNPDRKWRPSWNEGIDRDATLQFINFASNPDNPHFSALRIVDSNTVEYAMVCDGYLFPSYKDYLSKLEPLVSKATFKNLLDAEFRHQQWSGYKTKFMDPTIVFDAFGLVPIPKLEVTIEENSKDYNIHRAQGFKAWIPSMENGEHPFSHPRRNEDESIEDFKKRAPEFAGHIERVEIYRESLRVSHAETWDIIETKN
jgi:hypothetical protein